jgi:hypothetical protein
MDFLGKKILSMASIQKAHMQTTADFVPHPHSSTHRQQNSLANSDASTKRQRHSGIPAIPSDIGFNSSKAIGGSKSTGVISNVSGNPAVIFGMGLTSLALLGMIRRSIMGDKVGTQKYMRYRIIAQFFTVTALVAGVTIFAKNPNVTNESKPVVAIANIAN